MKKQFKLWFAAAAVAAFTFTGCSKEDINTTSAGSEELSKTEINTLAGQAEHEFLYYGSGEDESFEGEYPTDDEGMPDAYQVTTSTADEIHSAKRDGKAAGIRLCLSKLGLDTIQIQKIRRAFAAYEDCKASIVKRHAAAFSQLIERRNAAMQTLVKMRRNGNITQKEFVNKVKELNRKFKQARFELAEKSRAALDNCYKKMLGALKDVLTDRQWKAFVDCYRK